MLGAASGLLIGGLLLGYLAGPQGITPLDLLFFDLFKGILAFFLLERGRVAASRIAVSEANAALSIGASRGVTFPFNLFAGIPLYYWMAQTAQRIVGGES